MIPTAVIVTRGDVDLAPVLESLPADWPVIVWNNAERDDMKVFGYFAALRDVQTEYVYTQADDAVCPAAELLAAWTDEDADRILLNVADGDTPWISFGAIFRRTLPDAALAAYLSAHPFDDEVKLWCEVIFCELTAWRNVDLGKTDLPWCSAPNRMWMQPNHYTDQAAVREKALAL